jgi:hypothetical protein
MSLNDKSGFNNLLSYYNKNKDRPWNEWLFVQKIFPRSGKQGVVGLMESKDDKMIVYVFKISQYLNHLVQHEYASMSGLNELSDFCPHYCRVVGTIVCEIDPTKKKDGNPFECDSSRTIEKEVLLLEYIDHSYKLSNYIKSPKISENILYSTIKQTLLGISIAQNKKKLTHYDLHSNNIMMKKCSKDLVILYVLDDCNQFCIPTHGCYPVIIDYGFSYSASMEGAPMWQTLNYTDVGFMSDRFDPFADPKLFLVTVADEMNEYKHNKNSKKLFNIVKNNYSSLKIDWRSGWDEHTSKCATDYVLEILSNYSSISELFSKQEYHCMDLLQTLIILPLEPQKYNNIDVPYTTFLKEFIKIENEISSPFYCIYILKGIVDAARSVRVEYNKKETRENAINYFKISIYEVIDSVVKYCTPKDVHFEKMLCSLLCLAKGIEGILHDTMLNIMSKKQKMYNRVPLKTPEELCAVIDINIEDPYEFNEKTTVLVVDCVKDTCYPIELNQEQTGEINSYNSISRGIELYKLISSQ